MNLSNLMKGKTIVLPCSKQDTEGEVIVLNKQDVEGELQVGFQSNSMYAKIDILKQYNFSQQGEIVVLNKQDIKGEIQVDFKLNSMNGKIGVLKEYNAMQQGEIIVATQDFKTQTYGELNVKGITNKSYGQVEVVPPPKEYATFEAIQDTFVRSTTPRVDYGYVPSMYAGDIGNNDICRSLVYIDFSPLNPKMCVTKAVLSLMSVDTNEEDIDLQLYSVDRQWQENNVTWRNNVDVVDLLQDKTSKQGELYTEFDITDYVNECRKGTLVNNGFLIKSFDENTIKQKAFYTKESNHPPRLIIEYYDPTLRNIEKSSIYGEINIHVSRNSNVQGELSVLQTRNFADSNLKGEINIPNDRVFGEIQVLYGKDTYGEINIYHKCQDDLEGEINIPNDRTFGEITIGNKNEIKGELLVSCVSLAQGEISIYKKDENNKQGELIVGFKNEIYGQIDVQSIGIIKGELQVISSDSEEIKGELLTGEVINQQGEIDIIGYDINNIYGEIIVKKDIEEEKHGEIIVGLKSELSGEIDVLQKSEKNGEITIGNKYLSDVDGELLVGVKDEVHGEFDVKEVKDLHGEIITANKFVNDMDGELIVGEYEFDGYVFIM